MIEMKAATMRPMWMDAEDATHYEEALIKACRDYPIDVVEEACTHWRKIPDRGKWWPTEQDLRALCQQIARPRMRLLHEARSLLRSLVANEQADANKPSPFAGGLQVAFREEMRKRLADHRFRAYFNPSHILFQGERDILVRTKVAEAVLNDEGADLVKQHGLRIEYCAEAFVRIREIQEEMTPAKDAWVGERMERLTLAIKRGENIKALIQKGEL